MKYTSSALLATLAFLPLQACNSGDDVASDNASELGSGTVRVLIGDAPVDDLVSFSAVLKSVRLVRSGGERTANLLSAPLSVEFLGLESAERWLSESTVDEGKYVRVEVGFRPGSYVARSSSGAFVQVDAVADELSAPVLVPESLPADGLQTLLVELDLRSSLMGDVASGLVTFDPTGQTLVAEPGESIRIEELEARVFDRDTGTLALSVDGFADDDLLVPLARTGVQVDADTLLVDRLGNELQPPSYYYTLLYSSLSIVEVSGRLRSDGALEARRIELEELAGVPGITYPVKLDGTIAQLAPGLLRLQIQEVSRGREFADPVLAALGNPAFVDVSLSTQTLRIFLNDEFVSLQELEIGQRVEIKFTSFISPPFPAARVDVLARAPEFTGRITSLEGLPDGFEIKLTEDSLAISSGLVASKQTPVRVEPLEDTSIVLDTLNSPELTSADLLVGLRVACRGPIRGTPDVPVLDHVGTRVRPGRLEDARVTNVAPLGLSFTTTGGTLRGTFGADVSEGPFVVLVEPAAVFTGAAESAAELEALFAALGPGEQLRVTLDGIGSGAPDELRAFTLRLHVR